MTDESCAAVREVLSALLDEESSGEEAQAARAHVERCASCRAWLDEVRRAHERLAAHPRIEPASGFNAAVMSRLTAGPLTRFADAMDRLVCTPARQIAAATAVSLVLSALILWGALHIVAAAPAPPARHIPAVGDIEPGLEPPPPRRPPRVPYAVRQRREFVWPEEW